MLTFPTSNFGRGVAFLWLGACCALLAFGFIQRDIHDMPVAFLWLLVGLAFPVGFIGLLIVGGVWTGISTYLGLAYSPFLDLLPYWFVIVALRYIQWFCVVPKVVAKLLYVLRRI